MRGRIRSIKPELFSDEKLWDLGQETGLPVLQGFTGLWCMADREGRFEWRPRALKTAILPYWEGDFSRVLDALVTRGFVVRYEVEGRVFGVVTNFLKHQTPNNREVASEIPPPPDTQALTDTSTRDSRVDDASCTPAEPGTSKNKSSGNGILGTEGSVASSTRGAPDGAAPSEPAAGEARPARKRSESAALLALKAALSKHVRTPPALSKSQGDRASERLRKAVQAGAAADLAVAADALVRAWVASPRASNAWALLDIPFESHLRAAAPANSSIDENGTAKHVW